jgi:TANFOR domain-containing protein
MQLENSFLRAQSMNQVVSVMPPYSNRISDYTTIPNKILDIITVNASELNKNDIYLEGSIRSIDNSIEVYTKPGHKPLIPISLSRLPSGPFLPYTLQYNDVRQIFDDQWLLYRGITRDQLQKEGLPEGSYQICFRIFSYATGHPITEYACSNVFNVSSVEAPIIIQPTNKSEIPFMQAQSLVFSWVTPPGAPITTQYKLRIIELNENGPNPSDALRSAGYPVFFETTVTGNVYLYSVANPKLTEGKKYAFIVTAIDPLGRTSFRNKGASEIYSFMYNAAQKPMSGTMPSPPPSPPIVVKEVQMMPAALTMNSIKGILKYKYKEDGLQPNEAIVLKNAKIKLVAKYVRKDAGTNIISEIYSKNTSSTIKSMEGENCIVDEIMDVKTTNQNGEFTFSFLSNYKTGKIGTIDCENLTINNSNRDVYPYLAFLSGNNKNLRGPQPSTETLMDREMVKMENSGSFHGTCDLYRYYMIEIEAPQNKYFLNPDQEDKYFLAPELGKTTDVGEVISFVKSFNLKVNAQSSKTDFSTKNDKPNLSGLNVYLFRKINFTYPVIFPLNDALPDKSDDFPLPIKSMELVAQTNTDENGIATLKRLVFNDDPQYQYYLYVNNAFAGDYNFAMKAPVMIDLKTLINPPQNNQPSQQNGLPIVNEGDINYANLLKEQSARAYPWDKSTFTFVQTINPKSPSIKIQLEEKNGLRKITDPKAVVVLKELYQDPDNSCLCSDGSVTTIGPCHDKGKMPMALVDTGLYTIENLAVEITINPLNVVGPGRSITVSCPGFADSTIEVNPGKFLKAGEQVFLTAVLRYGSHVSGRIIDKETKKPIANASVNLLNGDKAAMTNNDGYYSLEARLLNEKKKLIIAATGYETDTLEVYINQPNKQIDHALFKMLRRLDVMVWDPALGKGLSGMIVTLPNVMVPKISSSLSPNNPLLLQSQNNINNQANKTQTANVNLSAQSIQSVNSSAKQKLNTTQQNININTTQVGQMVNNSSQVSTPDQDTEPLTAITDAEGYVHLSFTSGSGDMFQVMVSNPETNSKNYPTRIVNANVPYNKYPENVNVLMIEGACMNGTVYVGESNTIPAEGAETRATIHGQAVEYTVSAITDKSGKFHLKNLPSSIDAKSGSFTLEIVKSGNVGISLKSYFVTKGQICKEETFHLKSYEGIDLSTFLGFPFDVTAWEEASDKNGGSVSGKIHLSNNNRFASSDLIEIKHIKVIKGITKNKDGVALAEPETLPVVTEINQIKTSIWNTFKGVAIDSSGIQIGVKDKQTLAGNIDTKVLIYYKSSADLNNFGGYGYDLPTVYLAASPSGSKKTIIPVFQSANQLSWPGAGAGEGFYVSAGSNDSIRYSIDGFPNSAFADPLKSYFDKNGLSLYTRLKAVIPSINPSNFKIEVGNLKIGKNGIFVPTAQPFAVQMGNWKLNCTNWTIGNEGLKVTNATLSTGVDIQIENLKFTNSQLQTDKAVVHLEKIKLLGVQDMIVNTNFKGFNYVYLHDGVYGWQVYAAPDPGKSTVGSVQGLPGIDPSDKVEFSSIAINSEGESYFVLTNRPFKLFNLVNFIPNASTLMHIYPTFMKMGGVYDFGIPYYEKVSGAMAFFKDGNNLAFKMMDMDVCNFNHKNLQYRLNAYSLTNQLFTANGTVEEPGSLPQIKVTLLQTPLDTKIAIDQGEKLQLGTGKSLDNLVGGIPVINHQWDSFKFSGDLKGMGSIPNQKMSFIADGVVKAGDQNISVSELPAFPGMTFTYDLANSRFIGTANLNMDLGGMKLSGNVTSLMDSKGWLFQAAGSMEVPGLGGANLYGMFGNYTGISAEVANKIGEARCLPSDFKQNMHGFFLSAGITKQVLPHLNWDFGVVSVDAGVDLSIDARTFMTFGQGGTVFGLGIMAEGHAFASGSCDVTCTSVTADAKLQVGISGDYNVTNHNFNIDGCASVALKLIAEQCVPVLVGCGPCGSLDLAAITLGATMHLDNINGFSMGITTQSCDQQCK